MTKKEKTSRIVWFSDITIKDVDKVGGKNASLGEMINNLQPHGVNIPDGFAVTSRAFKQFMHAGQLNEFILDILDKYKEKSLSLSEAGKKIRKAIEENPFPPELEDEICTAYLKLGQKYSDDNIPVAVRSSATAEDLPNASFAGQQETYLNTRGEKELLKACKQCFASLYTDRAIVYREKMNFSHTQVALSVGVQKMVCAEKSCSGVMFTVDTESGFPNVIVINGAWGLGENVVKGAVNPDQFYVFKPHVNHPKYKPVLEKKQGSKELKMVYSSENGVRTKSVPTSQKERETFVLTDEEILKLARWGVIIEEHYKNAMDIEWVKDDTTGEMFIVQARPETIHSLNKGHVFRSYSLDEENPETLATGLSIGNTIVTGKVKIVKSPADLTGIDSKTILVTEMTEPDWVPAMKDAAGIITDYGGRTCHAAIVSRELLIPAVVGTKNATKVLKDGQKVTLSSAEGEVGKVYADYLKYTSEEFNLDNLPVPETDVMLNLATPESAFKWWWLPVKGVGLARMEFIISSHIRVHPMALIHPERVADESEYEKIIELTKDYTLPEEYFIERLASGISKIAATFYPHPVILRTSDFKSNEYAGLIGGEVFEPKEENPMLGWRGAARYYHEGYCEGFALECKAIKKLREEIGMDNVIVMIPFCRTLAEAEKVLKVMEMNGLKRGVNGLQIYMMCEIPSNFILADKFAALFDGFSIGSNDLTQLILGVDRDSGEMAHLFSEKDEAVKTAIEQIVRKAHQAGIKVGFCGQAPSDDPDYAGFLTECGIDSISVVPDSTFSVIEKMSGGSREKKMASSS